MRAAVAVVFALACFVSCALAINEEAKTSIVIATDAAADTVIASELEVPTLPGRGSPCLPPRRSKPWEQRLRTAWSSPVQRITQFGGNCVVEESCPEFRKAHGYCAGIGVVCCKIDPPPAPPASTAVEADLVLTPAPVQVKPATPRRLQATPIVPLTTTLPIPAGINSGVNYPSTNFQYQKIGNPGCPLTKACFSCGCAATLGRITRNRVTRRVAPNVNLTGLKPFVDAVDRALQSAKAAGGQPLAAYNAVKSAGGLCCRAIKRPNGEPGSGHSNHSWGMAVDLYFGGSVDKRGDGRAQSGLIHLAPFFNAQRLFWAAGYSGANEDAMHFEASTQLINEWLARGLLK